ncbi:MAG: AraC family transcriptional regulator [Oscillospiraceae bacterium]|jgi:AraC-like DNA-binding protein|nr:AraC family transcriptional regulator [Oscillospiraceae bacterium]
MAFETFEHFSLAADLGVTVLDVSGRTLFASSVSAGTAAVLERLHGAFDCVEAERVALLYGCYQANRFGGRYIFLTPSGLVYCASPMTDEAGKLVSGALAGPFLMTDHEEYLDIDVFGRYALGDADAEAIRKGIHVIPVRTPAQTRAIGEQLFLCASYYAAAQTADSPKIPQITSAFPLLYSIEKEGELLAAISIGDIQNANALLNDILGQVLFHSGGNFEILRSRVVELTVLLSRAALKGGANIDAIFGLNYGFLKEIDALGSAEDLVLWLHRVTRRFAQHVFDYAGAKHGNVIYQAVSYIRRNYADKISLQDVADAVFLNPTYFSKIFREETGQTPGSYITGLRIEESKKLLKDLSVNIVDIPERIGFESQSYFTKVFKKLEDCTPGRFRQKFLESEKANA